jgi:phosphoglycolate phosphatase-like HAD superfamily hydrolase
MSGRTRPEVVVFDLDGTLLDSLPLVLAAISHAVEPFGTRPTMEIFARLGGPPERFLPPMIAHARNLPVALERLGAFHRDNAHLIQPYAGAKELLATMQTAGVRTALWTGRDRSSAEWLLQSHRLQACFATMVCGDDLATHKPDPAGLREILRRLDVPAERTLWAVRIAEWIRCSSATPDRWKTILPRAPGARSLRRRTLLTSFCSE